MPSQKVLEKKQQVVAELSEQLKNSVAGVLVSYKGITVADDTKLRRELREAGVNYKVIKNTLIKRAADDAGLEGLDPVLEGTTALATSDSDYVAAAKVLVKYAEASKTFEVKSGFMDGAVISVDEITRLAKIRQRRFSLHRFLVVSWLLFQALQLFLTRSKRKKKQAKLNCLKIIF